MTEENQSSAVRKPNVKWRVVDIVVAAIVAVASGVIFWAWDFIYAVPTALFDSLTPGLGGLFHFMWLFAGPLVAIIIRKPGAAFFGETIAAVIETLLGNPFGVAHALLIGMAQLSRENAVEIGELATHLRKARTSDLSVARGELIKQGLVYVPERGLVAFTVPGMSDFVLSQEE